MNYIKHLNSVWAKIRGDKRLRPTHIGLYVALFQEWNTHHFCSEFFISRQEIMLASKIGSKSTYHRCLTELHQWNYISYMPSKNPLRGSRIKIIPTRTKASSENSPISGQECPNAGLPLVLKNPNTEHQEVSTINDLKQENNLKIKKNFEHQVRDYFSENNWSEKESKKFFNHYQATGWKTGSGALITDWKAAAESWILKKENFRPVRKNKQEKDHLIITKAKNYDQPL